MAAGHTLDRTAPGAAVARHAREVLRAAPVLPAYRAALSAALTLPGNVLSTAPDARWARLVWTCCVAAGGCWENAVPVAVAVDLFMVALDLLDEVEDGDDSPLCADLGAARTLNVSTGLLLLAQRGLLAVAGGAAAADTLLDAGLRACSGQHTDLAPPPDPSPPLPLHDVVSVAAEKAGPLVAVACRLGAWRGGADRCAQDVYARFGAYLGVAAQLDNDLAAIRPGAGGKTDIALGRLTLPLTYAAQLGLIDDAGERVTPWASGAAHVTWVVAETYRRRALDLIPQLTADPVGHAALTGLFYTSP